MKLLHFTAEWCGPCKMMKPIIDEVVSEHNNLEYLAIDIDLNRETAIDHNVLAVPTFILLDDNDQQITSITGAMPKKSFIEALGL